MAKERNCIGNLSFLGSFDVDKDKFFGLVLMLTPQAAGVNRGRCVLG